MAEALKTFFSPQLAQKLAAGIARVWAPFPTQAFVKEASCGLTSLELLDRAKHIAKALSSHLPREYPDALAVLVSSLGAEHASDELVGGGMAPFFYLPHVMFVAERGLDDFDISMRAQYELTKRFTAEFSIRAYIARDPERTFAYLQDWATDENPHVRRLASEGTRLRLPWAARVPWLDQNPQRVLALLEGLKDDPASLVRRSVANSLNDLGKTHPQLLMSTCRLWLSDATEERRALIEHALRHAVKRGAPEALRLLGFGIRPAVTVEGVAFEPSPVQVGGTLSLAFSLRSSSRRPQELLVDLVVHFVKAGGQTAPKVFKLKRVRLGPSESAEFRKRVSFAPMTTRRHYPGIHRLEALVNGATYSLGEVEVR